MPCVAQLWSPGAGFADSKEKKRTEYKYCLPLSAILLGRTTDALLYKKEADLPPETDCVTLQIKVAVWCDLETSEVI